MNICLLVRVFICVFIVDVVLSETCTNVCEWAPWQDSSCSVTCGGGVVNRIRGLCCPVNLTFNECLTYCGKSYNDSQGQGYLTCNENCLNGGSYYSGSCHCLPKYYGSCCSDLIACLRGSFCPNGVIFSINILFNSANHGPVINNGNLTCYPNYTGYASMLSICHPQPADMIFLLDSSVSQTELNFMKQLEFVSNFTDHILIGPNDTQISIITFSSDAIVEFDLATHNNSISLKKAIQSIKFNPGITRTDKALQKAKEVAVSSRQRRRPNGKLARVFVFVITDGMSTYREKTKQEAINLKNFIPEGIAAIGIGKQVSHQELRDIATSSSSSPYVFSVDNFDSLYTMVTQLVHITCTECTRSAVSDVILMIDEYVNTSNAETFNGFSGSLVSASKLIQLMDTLGSDDNDTHISLTSLSNTVRTYANFSDHLSREELLITISKISNTDDKISNISAALNYINMHGFKMAYGGRLGARKFVVVFTNGGYSLDAVFDLERNKVLEKGIKIIVVGVGSNIDVDYLQKIASSPFHVIVETEELNNNLDVIEREFVYDACDLDFID
ncbi:hypothetical protein ACJMK2_011444 [Sinanodonta woodiana]|uniref:VWFA domain-containing protein n=1 Tax=Sinanodonta woodiana TaxID=1069815 RepID=A0ABD3V6C1_SINWO